MKRLVVGVTGASGVIYAERLLSLLSQVQGHQTVVILSTHAKQIANQELGRPLQIPPNIKAYDQDDMTAPFASGSSVPSAMVIVPCSMGTLGRLANGISNNLILRAADVILKERKQLILVIRETPLNRIHLRNMLTLHDAGAVIMPACPAFYHRPKTITELIDTIIARILDHLGIDHGLVSRWGEPRV